MPKYKDGATRSFTVTWASRGVAPSIAVTVAASSPEEAIAVAQQDIRVTLDTKAPTVT